MNMNKAQLLKYAKTMSEYATDEAFLSEAKVLTREEFNIAIQCPEFAARAVKGLEVLHPMKKKETTMTTKTKSEIDMKTKAAWIKVLRGYCENPEQTPTTFHADVDAKLRACPVYEEESKILLELDATFKKRYNAIIKKMNALKDLERSLAEERTATFAARSKDLEKYGVAVSGIDSWNTWESKPKLVLRNEVARSLPSYESHNHRISSYELKKIVHKYEERILNATTKAEIDAAINEFKSIRKVGN